MADAKPKVLLVEDDSFMVTLLTQGFKAEGFEVLLANDGDEAVKKFQESKPDALIIDILLPRKSGLEALREIRQLEGGERTPTIILSNLEDHRYFQEAQALGASAYLIKANTLVPEIVAKAKEAIHNK